MLLMTVVGTLSATSPAGAADGSLGFPLGLRMGMSTREVEDLLGPPYDIKIGRWHIGNRIVHGTFSPTSATLEFLSNKADLESWRQRAFSGKEAVEDLAATHYVLPSNRLMEVALLQDVADCQSMENVVRDAEDYITTTWNAGKKHVQPHTLDKAYRACDINEEYTWQAGDYSVRLMTGRIPPSPYSISLGFWPTRSCPRYPFCGFSYDETPSAGKHAARSKEASKKSPKPPVSATKGVAGEKSEEPNSKSPSAATVLAVIGFVLAAIGVVLGLYLLPTIVAYRRGHNNTAPIFVVKVLR